MSALVSSDFSRRRKIANEDVRENYGWVRTRSSNWDGPRWVRA